MYGLHISLLDSIMFKKFNNFSILFLVLMFTFLAGYFIFDILGNLISITHNLMLFKISLIFTFSIIPVLLTSIAYNSWTNPNRNSIAITPQSKIMEIFDLMDDEIIVVDASSLKFLFANKSLLDNTLYKKEDLLGKSIMTLYPGIAADTIKQNIEKLIKNETDLAIYESTRTKKDGSTYQAYVRLKYFNDTNTFMSISRNITLEQDAQNMKNQCVSNVNHDIRTSLTKISGALKIISSGMVGEIPMRMSDMLNLANENTLKLLDEINDLINNQNLKA